jgi:hypothetical protein
MTVPQIPDTPLEAAWRGVVVAGPVEAVRLRDAVLACAMILPPSAARASRSVRATGDDGAVHEGLVGDAPGDRELGDGPAPLDPADDGDRIASGSDWVRLGAVLELPPGRYRVTVAFGRFVSNEVEVEVAADD